MVEDPIEQKINKNNPRNFREIFKKNLLSIPMVDLEQKILVSKKEVNNSPEVEEIRNQMQPYLKDNNTNLSHNYPVDEKKHQRSL